MIGSQLRSYGFQGRSPPGLCILGRSSIYGCYWFRNPTRRVAMCFGPGHPAVLDSFSIQRLVLTMPMRISPGIHTMSQKHDLEARPVWDTAVSVPGTFPTWLIPRPFCGHFYPLHSLPMIYLPREVATSAKG